MGMLYVTETRKRKKDYSQPFHLISERIFRAWSLTQSLTLSLPEFLVWLMPFPCKKLSEEEVKLTRGAHFENFALREDAWKNYDSRHWGSALLRVSYDILRGRNGLNERGIGILQCYTMALEEIEALQGRTL